MSDAPPPMDQETAFRAVVAGYVAPRENSHESATDLWCRVVARGRVVEQHDDGCRDYALRVCLAIVADPDLPPDEVYALFWMGLGCLTVYRTSPTAARAALRHHAAFNL